MLFWSVMGASVASALLPLINIEAILAVSVSQSPHQVWGLLAAATIGQMLGKILWYWGGMHLDRAPWVHRHLQKPKAKASLDRWHALDVHAAPVPEDLAEHLADRRADDQAPHGAG